MPSIDPSAPIRLLSLGYEPDDWLAIFLKSYRTGAIAQRIAPLSLVTSTRFLAWLRARNAAGWNLRQHQRRGAARARASAARPTGGWAAGA
jgi:hypothetical protein